VGVTGLVGEGVMLPVHGDPSLAALSRRDPDECAENHVRDGVHDERAVREAAVQVDRGDDDPDLTDQ
jgi:hypothetical protein